MMNGVPWRGPKEQHLDFFKNLILSSIDKRDVIIGIAASLYEDYYYTLGRLYYSIYPCCATKLLIFSYHGPP